MTRYDAQVVKVTALKVWPLSCPDALGVPGAVIRIWPLDGAGVSRIGSLCSGSGGLDMAAVDVLGGTVAWHCENDPAASKVLDAHWPDVPNHGDLITVDWTAVEPVDVLTAGYPCQPFSHAGRRKGADDARHIWPNIADAVCLVRPRLVLLENVPGHLSLGFGQVLADLAELGYVGRWACLRAAGVGAPHGRKRVFIAAENADRATGSQWRGAAPGQAESWRARPDAGRRGGTPPTDTPGDGRDERRPQPARLIGGPHAALSGGEATADAGEQRRDGRTGVIGAGRHPTVRGEAGRHAGDSPVAWGVYTAGVRRWAATLGRPAPVPTEPGRTGQPRLSPRFVEWMMGLPAGWVTDCDISRNAMLKILGNGVVPQQAAAAYRMLLGRPVYGAPAVQLLGAGGAA